MQHRLWHLVKGLFAPGDRSDPLTHALIAACARELDAAELRAYLELPESAGE